MAHQYSKLLSRLSVWARRWGSRDPEDDAHRAVLIGLRHARFGRALQALDDQPGESEEVEQKLVQETIAWLHGVVKYVVLEGLRRASAQREVAIVDAPGFDAPDGSLDPLDQAINAESSGILRDCLATLEPNVRQALRMWARGYSLAEIAAALGKKQSTVTNWIYREGLPKLSRCFHARDARRGGTEGPDGES